MTKHLHIGGLVAAGLDPSGAFLLTISHAGRGVYSTATWERVARDPALAYPTGGRAPGFGPVEGILVPVTEIDHHTGVFRFSSPDGSISFEYESGTLTVSDSGGA